MKRLAAFLCAVLLALSLAACGGKESPAPLPETSPAPESPAPSEAPEPEPVPLPELQPGRILPLWDERLNFNGATDSETLATQAELDRWNQLIPTAPVVRMDFSNMHQAEGELTVEQEQEILTALRGAALRLYPPDHKDNPFTGGSCQVIAYDAAENILFHVNYMGNWFLVQFGSEETRYLFDGEGTTLDDILSGAAGGKRPSAPAPADNWERMLATYYYPYYPEGTLPDGAIADPQGLLPEGAVIHPERLIETYSTGTSGKEECLALMDKLRAGQKLGELIESRGELYTVVTGPDGEEMGDALIRMDRLEVMAYGAFPEPPDAIPFRRDCDLTDDLKAQLEESGLDLSKTTLTFCIINGFSNGALFSDGEKEFFVPTAESSENIGVMEVGQLYPVPTVPGLVEKALPELYPAYLLGGSCDIPLGFNEWGPADALSDYLESHLTEEQYSGIVRMGSFLRVMVPNIAPVEALLPSYSGRMPPIDYQVVPYSKTQLTKAEQDVQAFLADHPEVEYYSASRTFGDVCIILEKESPVLDAFLADYPLKNVYRVIINPGNQDLNPD